MLQMSWLNLSEGERAFYGEVLQEGASKRKALLEQEDTVLALPQEPASSPRPSAC